MQVVLICWFSIFQNLKPQKINSNKFSKLLGASVILEDITWEGLSNCASPPISSQNFQPVLRNPVDLINASYGQLLSYIVPEVNKDLMHSF